MKFSDVHNRHYRAVVIGAGQAGLAAAHELHRRGLRPGPDGDFLVLDANDGPGGAWRHRWDSLTLGRAHGIADLPGFPMPHPDPAAPAATPARRRRRASGTAALLVLPAADIDHQAIEVLCCCSSNQGVDHIIYIDIVSGLAAVAVENKGAILQSLADKTGDDRRVRRWYTLTRTVSIEDPQANGFNPRKRSDCANIPFCR